MAVPTTKHADKGKPPPTDLTEVLDDLKHRLHDPVAAEQARTAVLVERRPFDPEAFRAFVTQHPVFSRMHLVTEDE